MSPQTANQNPEQKARDRIDGLLELAGWLVQDKKKLDFSAGKGIAVREYQTDAGPADYVLFVDKHAARVIEAKPADWGHKKGIAIFIDSVWMSKARNPTTSQQHGQIPH